MNDLNKSLEEVKLECAAVRAKYDEALRGLPELQAKVKGTPAEGFADALAAFLASAGGMLAECERQLEDGDAVDAEMEAAANEAYMDARGDNY